MGDTVASIAEHQIAKSSQQINQDGRDEVKSSSQETPQISLRHELKKALSTLLSKAKVAADIVGSSCRDCRDANLLAGPGLVASPISMALERAQPAILRRELLHQPASMAVARANIFAKPLG